MGGGQCPPYGATMPGHRLHIIFVHFHLALFPVEWAVPYGLILNALFLNPLILSLTTRDGGNAVKRWAVPTLHHPGALSRLIKFSRRVGTAHLHCNPADCTSL